MSVQRVHLHTLSLEEPWAGGWFSSWMQHKMIFNDNLTFLCMLWDAKIYGIFPSDTISGEGYQAKSRCTPASVISRAEDSRRATAHSTLCGLCWSELQHFPIPAHGLLGVSGFYFCISHRNLSLFPVESMTMSYKAGPCSQALSV